MILAYASRGPFAGSEVEVLRALFAEQWVRCDADLDGTLRELRNRLERDAAPGEGRDFGEVLDDLAKAGLVRREGGRILTTRKTASIVRDAVFERVFAGSESAAPAGRSTPASHRGSPPERQSHTRPWEHGDDFRDLDWNATLRNALRRGVGPAGLREGDLEVLETERASSCATVLLIDVSHSMALPGTDGLAPAKMVAIGLAEFVRRHRPRDTLDVLAFGDNAWRIPIASIPSLAAGPFHTNTADGLRLARGILRDRRASRKRIFVVTDGKPSCALVDGRLRKRSVGLDPLVVERTLAEGRRCLSEGCRVSTFMVARDPELVGFVERFTREVRGQAFFAGAGRLGECVLREWHDRPAIPT